MPKKKTHLKLKLGSLKQREVFNNVMIRRYLNETGKEYFSSDSEREAIQKQLDDVWEIEFEDHAEEFTNLTARELEDIFETVPVSYDAENSGDEIQFDEPEEELENIQQTATALIMSIPLQESGFDTGKIRFNENDPLERLNDLERIQVRWAYDVASRVARYVHAEDKELRKYLRREIRGLLSAYIHKRKIIPVRDLMIKEYKTSLMYL